MRQSRASASWDPLSFMTKYDAAAFYALLGYSMAEVSGIMLAGVATVERHVGIGLTCVPWANGLSTVEDARNFAREHSTKLAKSSDLRAWAAMLNPLERTILRYVALGRTAVWVAHSCGRSEALVKLVLKNAVERCPQQDALAGRIPASYGVALSADDDKGPDKKAAESGEKATNGPVGRAEAMEAESLPNGPDLKAAVSKVRPKDDEPASGFANAPRLRLGDFRFDSLSQEVAFLRMLSMTRGETARLLGMSEQQVKTLIDEAVMREPWSSNLVIVRLHAKDDARIREGKTITTWAAMLDRDLRGVMLAMLKGSTFEKAVHSTGCDAVRVARCLDEALDRCPCLKSKAIPRFASTSGGASTKPVPRPTASVENPAAAPADKPVTPAAQKREARKPLSAPAAQKATPNGPEATPGPRPAATRDANSEPGSAALPDGPVVLKPFAFGTKADALLFLFILGVDNADACRAVGLDAEGLSAAITEGTAKTAERRRRGGSAYVQRDLFAWASRLRRQDARVLARLVLGMNPAQIAESFSISLDDVVKRLRFVMTTMPAQAAHADPRADGCGLATSLVDSLATVAEPQPDGALQPQAEAGRQAKEEKPLKPEPVTIGRLRFADDVEAGTFLYALKASDFQVRDVLNLDEERLSDLKGRMREELLVRWAPCLLDLSRTLGEEPPASGCQDAAPGTHRRPQQADCRERLHQGVGGRRQARSHLPDGAEATVWTREVVWCAGGGEEADVSARRPLAPRDGPRPRLPPMLQPTPHPPCLNGWRASLGRQGCCSRLISRETALRLPPSSSS